MINRLGIVSALLLISCLAWAVFQLTSPSDVDKAREKERRQYLLQLQVESRAALSTYGWVDMRRQIVRLPLARALALSPGFWQDPAVGRSNLLARLAKSTAKLAPQPNPYE